MPREIFQKQASQPVFPVTYHLFPRSENLIYNNKLMEAFETLENIWINDGKDLDWPCLNDMRRLFEYLSKTIRHQAFQAKALNYAYAIGNKAMITSNCPVMPLSIPDENRLIVT